MRLHHGARRNGEVRPAPVLRAVEPQARFPFSVELRSAKLPKRSWVKVSQVRTLSTERLAVRIGKVSPEELQQVLEGLSEILGG